MCVVLQDTKLIHHTKYCVCSFILILSLKYVCVLKVYVHLMVCQGVTKFAELRQCLFLPYIPFSWMWPSELVFLLGLYITCKCRLNTEFTYHNNEGVFSIVLMAKVDADFSFILAWCYARWSRFRRTSILQVWAEISTAEQAKSLSWSWATFWRW